MSSPASTNPGPWRALSRARRGFSPAQWRHLAGFYGFIALLHLAGWGLFLHYSARYPSLVGLGLAAYLLGLRHAFDADHIAVVDDTVRYLMQRGRKPLGVGFFFSLGHSTVVFSLALALVFAAAAVKQELPQLRSLGALIGTGVSGAFLWMIGALNLLVLLDILDLWRQARSHRHDQAQLDQLLARRGLLTRLLGSRLQRLIEDSWEMYPVGLLFGLGFDTASEVALLGMTAGASSSDLPPAAALSLPLLFAAGMSLIDTTDGVLMTRAYNWALVNPLRRIFYNATTTALSIAAALLIGTVELLQLCIALFGWRGRFFDWAAAIDFGSLGYVLAGLFLAIWVASVALWKLARVE
jgi:high-affinity nickel-transport protein